MIGGRDTGPFVFLFHQPRNILTDWPCTGSLGSAEMLARIGVEPRHIAGKAQVRSRVHAWLDGENELSACLCMMQLCLKMHFASMFIASLSRFKAKIDL